MSDWRPTATIENLQKRAELLAYIRQFFLQKGVMEVDTPVMSHCAVSDPFIDSIEVSYHPAVGLDSSTLYLQTSPEYAMKRILAAGSGAIYQMSKVFRNGESGSRHNPEFTMLEWYQPGYDDQDLMSEVEVLVGTVLGLGEIERITYSDLFQRYLGFRPEEVSARDLKSEALKHIDINLDDDNPDTWLNLLISNVIEPQLKSVPAIFVTEYPESQAALAKVKGGSAGIKVAARFELFIKGIELANGYHELTDFREQDRRLTADQLQRAELGLPQRPLDKRLVDALESGMPDCAGVALGVDRLLMLLLDSTTISEVIPFDHARA
ncbi:MULTISPECIES: elongation factor P--(R)-beta-lysine ligase [unclassified Neptuniibacter]|uniref:elongation factor P--(R)-beta-lysine ligase n=1 Tax=unclassified Neptuniibacter TaxID=2630693 RepID=UPI0025F45743|nr:MULTISPECIES: elongation factor P--(R)-beta-lysine ligase [unclassified Neptuniibacter]|tara:strand:+ start:1559 stop:2527 length:969 start_codon:yes stop_codon:yes gene_type:complete